MTLVEYTIHHNFSHKELKKLWQEYFPSDQLFFFNFYDGFIRLKLTGNNKRLDDYILTKKWRWEKNPYNMDTETLPVFKRNFLSLCKILHGYSVLILNEKDLSGIQNRVIHLFMNMRKKSYLKEAEELMRHALHYAQIEGIYQGINKSKEISQ